MTGSLRTPPAGRRTVTFAFSGDEAGQGWGINPAGGDDAGSTRRCAVAQPDFFIHSGDQIYADGPIKAEVTLDDGSIWKNLTTPAKSKVAETLEEFRGNFAYNLLDANKRRFAAEVPFLVQWDDHETRNNWYPGQTLGDERYTVRSASLLSAFARRAMFDYNPFRFDPIDPERVYRGVRLRPLARRASCSTSAATAARTRRTGRPSSTTSRPSSAPAQLRWLKQALLASRATWKVIASDMPLSIVVDDLNPDVPKGTFEAWANGDHGAPLGRRAGDRQPAALHQEQRHQQRGLGDGRRALRAGDATTIPDAPPFTDFTPFWEFVAGPINAGTFGPGEIDRTFGPDVKYVSVPAGMKQNRPPSDGMQYFGLARIDGETAVMTVSLHDRKGTRCSAWISHRSATQLTPSDLLRPGPDIPGPAGSRLGARRASGLSPRQRRPIVGAEGRPG